MNTQGQTNPGQCNFHLFSIRNQIVGDQPKPIRQTMHFVLFSIQNQVACQPPSRLPARKLRSGMFNLLKPSSLLISMKNQIENEYPRPNPRQCNFHMVEIGNQIESDQPKPIRQIMPFCISFYKKSNRK